MLPDITTMTTEQIQCFLQAARDVLAHKANGVHIKPEAIQWARNVIARFAAMDAAQ